MLIQEYVVREQDGLWEVRLGGQLLSGQSTQRQALNVAEALGHAASLRGERWKIVNGDHDETVLELPLKAQGRRPLFRA